MSWHEDILWESDLKFLFWIEQLWAPFEAKLLFGIFLVRSTKENHEGGYLEILSNDTFYVDLLCSLFYPPIGFRSFYLLLDVQ